MIKIYNMNICKNGNTIWQHCDTIISVVLSTKRGHNGEVIFKRCWVFKILKKYGKKVWVYLHVEQVFSSIPTSKRFGYITIWNS
ncbi:hypothetical protein ABEB36_007169 [Hypothenemus hampei]|uniref:Uncharacterized protein n=1 Tax=Hypothenemus hampei TaxID=57062 RepID=A0ABD1EVB8_HYPHA